MNADTDPQRLGYVVDQRVIEVLHALRHIASGGERLAAARLDPAVEAEQRHHTVADELVDAPARRLDRVAGLGKIAIEEEDQIIGQLLFGELGKGSQVAEQDRDVALGTVQIAGPMESVARLRGRRQERRHA